MEKLLLQDKKGVSEMIGYVLLVLIAVAVSLGVYAYLKLQVPKGNIPCENDVTIIIQDATCRSLGDTTKQITSVTLSNKGLYRIDGAYIRLGPLGKKAKTWINDPTKVPEGLFYLTNPDTGTKGLQPGDKLSFTLPAAQGIPAPTGSGAVSIYELEVQPATFTSQGLLAACDTIATQEIQCT